MVGCVEGFHPELQLQPLVNGEVLEHGEIEIGVSGPADVACQAREIAQLERHRNGEVGCVGDILDTAGYSAETIGWGTARERVRGRSRKAGPRAGKGRRPGNGEGQAGCRFASSRYR